jgi:sporulation protein YlmC with PRC-barrel domain
MHLNELLGHRVTDAAGHDIGGVADVRLVQDGPLQPSMQAALRIDGLIVVERKTSRLLGYERHVGPALIRRLVVRRLGNVWYIPWEDIVRITEGVVEARTGRDDLKPLEDMARY